MARWCGTRSKRFVPSRPEWSSAASAASRWVSAQALPGRPRRLIIGPIEALFALPKITLVPLFILWMGIGSLQHITFTALVVFFFFFFAMFNGVHGIPAALNNTLTLAGASSLQRVVILYLPASFGWIVIATRLAMPYAFVAAVSTEVIASTSGLGHLVKASSTIMNSAGMFAAMLALLFVSLAASSLANFAAARSRWKL